MAKTLGKNKWALFLLILLGLVLGSFIGYLLRKVEFLSWLDYGIDFSIGASDGGDTISIDLGALAVHFGIRLRITIASVLGSLASILIYKKL
ncbi:MAG: DUF4321 domain-containing protein [Clostridiales bacterium]|nr:DUF4321 domain-containing protein [Clostridiales bacterium]